MKKLTIIIYFLFSLTMYSQSICNNYEDCLIDLLENTCNKILNTSDSLLLKFELTDWDFSAQGLNKENLSDKIIFFNLFPDNFADFTALYGWNELLV